MQYRIKAGGFTLLEVLVVVGIFTLIIGTSFTLLSSSRLSTDITEAQIQVAEHARLAMDRITKELRLSHFSRVRISGNLKFTAAETNPGSVINFQIPVGSYDDQLALDPNNALQWGCAANPGHYLAYSVDGNHQLLRTAYTDQAGSNPTSQIIAQNIASVSFSRTSTSSNLISITLVAQRQTAAGLLISHTLGSNVSLRN